MGLEERLKVLSDRVRSHSSSMLTEEAVKTAVVLPFLRALGYDVFNPAEVIPEYTADAVGKKGEKVDYAIMVDGQIRILIECKPISTVLERVHLAQLFRYFSVTTAKFAILTNGRSFQFFSDLEEPNKLDVRPFLSFDLADMQQHLVSELRKFEKAGFNVDGILASAERLKYTSALKAEISKLIDNPSEDFVRIVAADVHAGRFTAPVLESFKGLIRNAFREVIRESVQSRLTSALADTELPETQEEPQEEIQTTPDEIEAFMIVRAIVRDIIKPSRVSMRDQRSYCGVLIDDNNRKPLARFHLDRRTKYLSLFDRGTEERVTIQTLDDIFDYADRLRATANQYKDPTARRPTASSEEVLTPPQSEHAPSS